MIDTLLGLGALAAFVLIGFGVRGLIARDIDRLKAGLMVGAGIVVLINVWLYSLPRPRPSTAPALVPASPRPARPASAGTSGSPSPAASSGLTARAPNSPQGSG